MYTLSNTGTTVTFGGDTADFKKAGIERVTFGYDQVKNWVLITVGRGSKVCTDRKNSNRAYATKLAKAFKRMPAFGAIHFDTLEWIGGSKTFAVKLPEVPPMPRPLKPHEKEFNGRRQGEPVVPEPVQGPIQGAPIGPQTDLLMTVGNETLAFNVPTNEAVEIMMRWIKQGYMTG